MGRQVQRKDVSVGCHPGLICPTLGPSANFSMPIGTSFNSGPQPYYKSLYVVKLWDVCKCWNNYSKC